MTHTIFTHENGIRKWVEFSIYNPDNVVITIVDGNDSSQIETISIDLNDLIRVTKTLVDDNKDWSD